MTMRSSADFRLKLMLLSGLHDSEKQSPTDLCMCTREKINH